MKILGLSGSLRQSSSNMAALRAIEKLAGDDKRNSGKMNTKYR